jgi:hypothetical protein
MPRRLRFASGGYVYQVLNRAVGRARIFKKSQDYAVLERVLNEANALLPVGLLASCSMPKYWHLVLWPFADGTVPRGSASLRRAMNCAL